MPETPETDSPTPRNESEGKGRPKMPGGAARTNNTFMGRGGVVWLLLIGFLVILLIMMTSSTSSKEVAWQKFQTYAQNKEFEGPVIIHDNRIVGTLKETASGDAVTSGEEKVHVAISHETRRVYLFWLDKFNQDFKEDPSSGFLQLFLFSYGPIILIVLLIYFFVFRGLRNAGGGPGMLGNFGRSKHKMLTKEHSSVRLGDVEGIDEAKQEVGEIIQFLRNPKKFQRLGGRVPRGVLLIGRPGCGKTLLAKAVAGEAEVPFFSISGSDFVEMFVGVGASRVRDLFKQAKDSSPCIIFLDEIDAVGRRRGGGSFSGGHDEREQTLNAILVEMDGFDSSDQVIVMAATNRADVLDPALTRPGRFDRSITVPLPDVVGRMAILKVHAKKIRMSPDIDLERLARATPMFSGAELAALINEAAIGATLADKDFVEQEDLEEARDKIRFGRARKSRRVEEEEKVATAYHEAGHAVLQYLLKNADPLHKVTIIPRGQYGGATFSLPEKDRYSEGRKYLHDFMRITCGGRIAEERRTGDVNSGVAMDIRQITQAARSMVRRYGMSEKLGFVDYAGDEDSGNYIQDRGYSEQTAELIDQEIKALIDDAYADATRLINEHWDQVVAIAEALIEHETLSFDDVDNLMQGKVLNKPTVAELLEEERRRAEKIAREAEAEKAAEASEDSETDEGTSGMMPAPA